MVTFQQRLAPYCQPLWVAKRRRRTLAAHELICTKNNLLEMLSLELLA
jgi:hypothetical protein